MWLAFVPWALVLFSHEADIYWAETVLSGQTLWTPHTSLLFPKNLRCKSEPAVVKEGQWENPGSKDKGNSFKSFGHFCSRVLYCLLVEPG